MLDLDLSNKRFLVVGASSGIGKQIALELGEQGAAVTAVGRDIGKLESVLSELSGDGHDIYSFDITNLEQIEGFVKGIVQKAGKYDGAVFSAGISEVRPLRVSNLDFVQRTFTINYFPFLEFIRIITKKKYCNKPFSIVGISSCASVYGGKGQSAYSASKAAMDASTRVIAQELAKQDVRINTVRPGNIMTPMYCDGANLVSERERKELDDRQFLGLGMPEDVASMVLYLLSPLSKFITGSALAVDGGFTCH